MTSDEESRLRAELSALRAPMLRLRLYVIIWTKVAGADKDAVLRTQAGHIRWQLSLEEQGILFGSGAVFDDNGDQTPQGMTIVRAASVDATRTLAESEPFVRAGLRTYAIQSWVVNEGSFSVRVRLGTGTFDFT